MNALNESAGDTLRIYGNLSLLEMAPVLLAAKQMYPGKTIVEHGSVMALWGKKSDLASLDSDGAFKRWQRCARDRHRYPRHAGARRRSRRDSHQLQSDGISGSNDAYCQSRPKNGLHYHPDWSGRCFDGGHPVSELQ